MQKVAIAILTSAVLVGASVGIYYGVNSRSRAGESQSSTGGSEKDVVPTESPTFSFEPVGCIRTPIQPKNIKTSATSQNNDVNVEVVKDIVYGKGAIATGEKDLKLDIYRPALIDGSEKYPLMIHIHGGAFIAGSKDDYYMAGLSNYWASKGFVVASINYRLLSDLPIVDEAMKPMLDYSLLHLSEDLPSPSLAAVAVCSIEDTLLAYEHLKGFSYVDEEVVVMNGYSAGAITSLWATYGVDNFGMTRPPVKAVLSHYGLLMADQSQTNELVNADDPPVFMTHATGDFIVPYDGTQYLANRMESLGLNYALHCEESYAHEIDLSTKLHSNGMTILEAENIWLQNLLD